MAEAAPRHFCHFAAECSHYRRNNEASFVPHSACAVFIHCQSSKLREVNYISGMHHSFGERRSFSVIHAGKIYRHEQGRNLIVRYIAIYVAGNNKLYFLI